MSDAYMVVLLKSHPSDEDLAVYAEGNLYSLSNPILVNDHLNFCPRCYAIVHDTREALREMKDDS